MVMQNENNTASSTTFHRQKHATGSVSGDNESVLRHVQRTWLWVVWVTYGLPC